MHIHTDIQDLNLRHCPYAWVFFDFGGVLAEEGFVNGLRALGRAEGIDPEEMIQAGIDTVFGTGFVLGQCSESDFWAALNQVTGANIDEEQGRQVILDAFVLRPWMLDIVDTLQTRGTGCAILSDQVTWLDMLEQRQPFFFHFQRIFNSYHLGKSKRDPSLFQDVLTEVGTQPEKSLFIDDSQGNIYRAADKGLATLLYTNRSEFMNGLNRLCP